MRSVTRAGTAACVLAFFTGCGGEQYDVPAGIAVVAANKEDIVDGMLIAVRDRGTLLKVIGTDDAGQEIELDSSRIEWTTDDPASLEVLPLGTACMVTGIRDWFDTVPENGDPASGTEPAMTLTVKYRGLEAALPASVVIDGSGTWVIDVSTGSLAGNEMALDLVQHGRTLVYEELGFEAEIDGRHMALAGFGFTFDGEFTGRASVAGTYTDLGGSTGEWSGTKN